MRLRIGRDWLLVLAGLVSSGCNPTEIPTDPRSGPGPLTAFGNGFTEWGLAGSIEQAAPGAHAEFNTSALEGCPFISPDGKSFYMASNRPDGLGGIDIWVSTRKHHNDPWGAPVNLGEPVNSSVDDFCPTLGRDLHTFYFVSRRQAGVAGVDWCGGADIYVTRLREDGSFEAPANLGCDVNSSADEAGPFPVWERAAGPVLYFSSTRPGLGAGDLYRSESHGGVFAAAEPVAGLNTAGDEGQPNLRHDGLELFFYSNRAGLNAQGGNDIWVATRSSVAEPWSVPVNLGPNVNSSAAETRPSLSWNGTELYFGSTRSGEGASDIYRSTRAAASGPNH